MVSRNLLTVLIFFNVALVTLTHTLFLWNQGEQGASSVNGQALFWVADPLVPVP